MSQLFGLLVNRKLIDNNMSKWLIVNSHFKQKCQRNSLVLVSKNVICCFSLFYIIFIIFRFFDCWSNKASNLTSTWAFGSRLDNFFLVSHHIGLFCHVSRLIGVGG